VLHTIRPHAALYPALADTARLCNVFRSFHLSSTSVHNDITLASESAVPAGTSNCAYALKAHHLQKITLY
jgi:hypothetical protein